MAGIDDELSMGEERSNVTSIEAIKEKRPAFHFWEVDEVQHKLKLTTSMISMLENKYKTNVVNMVMSDGTPPLTVMLTIIQAAITPWEHGNSFSDIQKLYDIWMEKDGGNQQKLMSGVILPTLAVSGFFTVRQAQEMIRMLKDRETMM